MRILLFTVILLTLIFSCSTSKPQLVKEDNQRPLLDYILSDNVVLQKNRPITFWGWANPKENISVVFDDKNYKVKSDKSGKWDIKIPEPKHNGPFNLKIIALNDSLLISNITIGDVWVCAGQSNMSWPLSKTQNYDSTKLNCCPNFRYRKIKKSTSDQANVTLDNQNNKDWLLPTENNCGSISGVAYHFAEQLMNNRNDHLSVLDISYSDSRIEGWIKSTKGLNNPTNKNYNNPGVIYNNMIAPIQNFPIRGIIWYQGESNNLNSLDSYSYRNKLRQLITDYKSLWGEDLKVVIIELPNYESIPIDGNTNWAILRESQKSIKDINGVTTVSTIDIGEPNNLHPPNKRTIGKRAAEAAISLIQSSDNLSSGPTYSHHTIKKNTISINFNNLGGGLMLLKGSNVQFIALGKDGSKKTIVGRKVKDQIVVDLDNIETLKELQYAWENNPKSLTIYNEAGYPASSFRISLM